MPLPSVRREAVRNRFLSLLRAGRTVSEAAAATGVERALFYRCRRAEPAFRRAWAAAARAGLAVLIARKRDPATRAGIVGRRRVYSAPVRKRFLSALAEGAAVDEAARAAGVNPKTCYKWRHADAAFAAAWDKASRQGTRAAMKRAEVQALAENGRPGGRGRRRLMNTPEAKALFLKHYGSGKTVAYAARCIGVQRRTVYAWRRADVDFACAWQVAEHEGILALLRKAADAAPLSPKRALYDGRRRMRFGP